MITDASEVVNVYRTEDGTLEDERGRTVTCSWFALCKNDATDVREHPILGGVPICARCDAKVEAL